MHIDNEEYFRAKWVNLTRQEQWRRWSSWEIPPEARLVLGIFSIAEDASIREIIRQTWMQRPGVCGVPYQGPPRNCKVAVTFVLGRTQGLRGHASQSLMNEKYMTFLDVPENMNSGKSQAWFRHATRQFGWATHFGKMDQDTFPHFGELGSSVRSHNSEGCPNMFIGALGEARADERCGQPLQDNFLEYRRPDLHCAGFMVGALYMLTRKLAEGVSAEGREWDHRTALHEPEDYALGHAVVDYARRVGACVGFAKLQMGHAYTHLGSK
eukprot:CAMPEP_0179021990 /NCGR_PEP_ID=MMETSP0796-20121207/6176_1 /TAXON_ID=73915 /ORGANISM="Pyrodinium bahamense, Strain pbaha01" /LENGTH=267 /DNA_ID=CAMNT_0020717841 /DNA_START=166 /DNA_END=969 /DNA_ORIENTATION=-